MEEDYYGDSSGDQSNEPSKQRDPEDESKTALIPESLCPGMDVGDTVKLEIVGVREGEYEVKYSKPKDEEKESDPEDMGSPEPSSGMGDYMED